jgi:hypothetical protein
MERSRRGASQLIRSSRDGIDAFERLFRDAQVQKSVLSVGVPLDVGTETIAPSLDGSARYGDLGAALPSATVEQIEGECVIAEVEVNLRLDANLVAPSILQISPPASNAIVAVVGHTPDSGEGGVDLDLRIAEFDVASKSRVLKISIIRCWSSTFLLGTLAHPGRWSYGRRSIAGPVPYASSPPESAMWQ